MKKIIGGLLVATLLTNQYFVKTDNYTYKIYNAQPMYMKKEEEVFEGEVDMPTKVDKLMDEIDKNNKDINTLLKDKYNIIGKIKAIMNIKAFAKSRFTDEQIATYVDFNHTYEKETNKVITSLEKIESVNLEQAKKELLKESADIDFIYDNLEEITSTQASAINGLRIIIDRGQQALAVL